MSLLFNMLSRLVITFLPRSKRLLISWLQSPSAVVLEPAKIKSATVSTVYSSICHEVMGHGTTDWFQIGKGVCQGCISSACLFNLYAEYIAGININILRYADDTTLMVKSQEELKSLLSKVKEESEKAGLKLNIQKMKIMASGPITSWQTDGETMETVRLFWGAPKPLQMVTAAMKLKDTCFLEEKL